MHLKRLAEPMINEQVKLLNDPTKWQLYNITSLLMLRDARRTLVAVLRVAASCCAHRLNLVRPPPLA